MANNYIMGVDIGGTKIEVAVIKTSNKDDFSHSLPLAEKNIRSFDFISRKRIPTEREKGYQDVLKRLISLIKESLEAAKLNIEDLYSIGLGLPGSVNPNNHQMIHGNSEIFEDKDIINDLINSFSITGNLKHKIITGNDANCFALAEALGGAGVNFYQDHNIPFEKQLSIGVILGTGVGGGVVIQGKLLEGKMGGGAEIGHSNLYPEGRPCYCDRKGCVELYLSGKGVEASYNALNPSMSEDPLRSTEIFTHFLNKTDQLAEEVINTYKKDLLRFLTNLSNIFDPHFIVLGGGVSNQDCLYENLNEELAKTTFLKDFPPVVYKNQLGDSAGVIGAALLPYLE